MHITLLHQAINPLREDEADTLVQVAEIGEVLHQLGHSITPLSIRHLGEIENYLASTPTDLVFNLVESFAGSDRFIYLITGLLEAHGIPFTGNRSHAMAITANKTQVKPLLHSAGIRTPLAPQGGDDISTAYIVKSVTEHSSFGLDENSIVCGAKAAQELIEAKIQQYGGEWLAETYIEGREFNLSLLQTLQGMVLLPPAEIVFIDSTAHKPHIIDYKAKWNTGSEAYHNTVRCFPDFCGTYFSDLAQRCWQALDLRGYARIDLRLDVAGTPWLIDINPNPCLSADAGFMAAAAQAGLSHTDVIAHLIESAFDEKPLHTTPHRHAA